MQRPQHSCEEYFLHSGPVLAFTRYSLHEYISLTNAELFYWYRAKQSKDHVFSEAPFANTSQRSSLGSRFVDFTIIPQSRLTQINPTAPAFKNAICVGATDGQVLVYSMNNQQLSLQGIIRSGNTPVQKLCFAGGTLYVLHRDGALRCFDQIQNLKESWPTYSKLGGAGAPVIICNGKCTAFAVQPCPGVNLILAATSSCVEVYTDDQDAQEPLTKCGFLSEDISHASNGARNICAIYTTANGIVVTGAKRGDLTSWVYEIESNDNYLRQGTEETTHRLQFRPTLGMWQHGKPVVQICLAPGSLWCYSFDTEGAAVVTDLKYNRVLDKFIAHAGRINCCSIYEQEGLMLTASDDCVAKVWQLWCPRPEVSVSEIVHLDSHQ